jgi:hypothetical protein
MICVKIYGGLGNQLFQYSAAKSLAIIHNTELVLDLSWFSSQHKSNTLRNYALKNFNINARIASCEEELFHFVNCSKLRNFFRKKNTNWTYYSEKSFGFDDQFSYLPDNTYLEGYWQSFKFFESIRPVLLEELMISTGNDFEESQLTLDLCSPNSVAIHIRRGDYISNAKAAKFHGTCSMEYYLKSINILREKINDPRFFIFSDDIDWVRMNMDFKCDVNYVDSNFLFDAHHDFYHMSLCNHFIIANSTFSWWAAWLSKNIDKKVIAPKNWFIKKIDTKSLFPDQWMLV